MHQRNTVKEISHETNRYTFSLVSDIDELKVLVNNLQFFSHLYYSSMVP